MLLPGLPVVQVLPWPRVLCTDWQFCPSSWVARQLGSSHWQCPRTPGYWPASYWPLSKTLWETLTWVWCGFVSGRDCGGSVWFQKKVIILMVSARWSRNLYTFFSRIIWNIRSLIFFCSSILYYSNSSILCFSCLLASLFSLFTNSTISLFTNNTVFPGHQQHYFPFSQITLFSLFTNSTVFPVQYYRCFSSSPLALFILVH